MRYEYNHNYRSCDRREDSEIYLVSNIKGVITVEDYRKWYSLYYIDNDGIVHKLQELYPSCITSIEGCDHYYYPDSLVRFAINNNLKIDYISYAAICYMFLEDSDFICDQIYLNKYLPSDKDLKTVLKKATFKDDIGGSFCDYFHIYPEFFSITNCIDMFSIHPSDDSTSDKSRFAKQIPNFDTYKINNPYFCDIKSLKSISNSLKEEDIKNKYVVFCSVIPDQSGYYKFLDYMIYLERLSEKCYCIKYNETEDKCFDTLEEALSFVLEYIGNNITRYKDYRLEEYDLNEFFDESFYKRNPKTKQ